MKHTGQCAKCGSTNIIADAKVVDRGHGNSVLEMTFVTYRRPEALIFKQRQHTTVSAWVCGSCGYAEFYADNPDLIEQPQQP